MKPYSRRTSSEWESTKHDKEQWISPSAMNEGGQYKEYWIGSVAMDGSSEGARGKHSAIGHGTAQLCLNPTENQSMVGMARYKQNGTDQEASNGAASSRNGRLEKEQFCRPLLSRTTREWSRV